MKHNEWVCFVRLLPVISHTPKTTTSEDQLLQVAGMFDKRPNPFPCLCGGQLFTATVLDKRREQRTTSAARFTCGWTVRHSPCRVCVRLAGQQ